MTVVIPTRERHATVRRALDALAGQEAPPGTFEVVVVVDGATDGTAADLAALPLPFPLRVLVQRHRGLAAARNRGAAAATGTAVLFLDDDMVPAPSFVAEMAGAVADGADVVAPRITIGDWVPDRLPARLARRWEAEAAEALATGRRRFDDLRFCAHAVRRAVFEAAGGFDESFTADGGYGNEDLDLGHRLLSRSVVVAYRPDAVVATDAEVDPATVLRRWRAVGGNDVRLAGKHPELADRLFDARVRRSRAHRAAAGLVHRWPGAAAVALRAGGAVVPLLARVHGGTFTTRAWGTLTALAYWLGVVDAGGSPAQGGRR